jgi:hypothetical protein
METINSERIKNLKANTRRVNVWLNRYQAMEVKQAKSRNVKTYDAAGEQMKYAYNMIIEEMNKMLNDVDILGCDCGALDINDFNRIEKHTFNA